MMRVHWRTDAIPERALFCFMLRFNRALAIVRMLQARRAPSLPAPQARDKTKSLPIGKRQRQVDSPSASADSRRVVASDFSRMIAFHFSRLHNNSPPPASNQAQVATRQGSDGRRLTPRQSNPERNTGARCYRSRRLEPPLRGPDGAQSRAVAPAGCSKWESPSRSATP